MSRITEVFALPMFVMLIFVLVTLCVGMADVCLKFRWCTFFVVVGILFLFGIICNIVVFRYLLKTTGGDLKK